MVQVFRAELFERHDKVYVKILATLLKLGEYTAFAKYRVATIRLHSESELQLPIKCSSLPLAQVSRPGGHGGVVVRLPTSHPGEPGSILGGVAAPGFSCVGIVPDDAASRTDFLGGFSFPLPLHSGAAPYSPGFTLIGSQDFAGRRDLNLLPTSCVDPSRPRGRGGVVVRKLAPTKANRVRFAAGSPPGFSHVGVLPDDSAGRRVFSGISHLPCCYIAPHSPHFPLAGSQDLDVNSCQISIGLPTHPNPMRLKCRNPRAGNGRYPRKPADHDSHMRKSGVARPGIEPGSPWWEASGLTAQPPWTPPVIHKPFPHNEEYCRLMFFFSWKANGVIMGLWWQGLGAVAPSAILDDVKVSARGRPGVLAGPERSFYDCSLYREQPLPEWSLLAPSPARRVGLAETQYSKHGTITYSHDAGAATTRLPPLRTGLDSRRDRNPDLRTGESWRTMSLVGGIFSGISRFPRSLHSCAAPYSPRFTLIGS
ncbi:hypothetical protein PR048_030565 [Dryococelus australis]|uniref:Uncharacterized protein n=1 Tax=Dryococelus australis TaxID=614101 RepID=A0ABQ9G9C6_9NEOP|nr:hypothetical protein PR048_030565 [Dryococelus australis]